MRLDDFVKSTGLTRRLSRPSRRPCPAPAVARRSDRVPARPAVR